PLAIPQIVVERVVNNHSDKSPNDHERLDVFESSVALPLTNVSAQRVIDPQDKFLPKHLRQLVFFQRGIEQKSLKLWIELVMIQSIESYAFKNGAVVFATDGLSDLLQRI